MYQRYVVVLGCSLLIGAGTAVAQVACENSSPLVGAAGGCAVFQLADEKVSMSHGDPTGVDGNVCMASGSELSMSGGQIITGTAFLEPGVDYPDDILERAGAVDFAADLSAEIVAANDASAALAALACDVTLSQLKVDETSIFDVRDFVPAGGQAVICVDGNMEVKGSSTNLFLTGQPGDSLVFNVSGSFKVNGAKVFAIDGLSAADVVYNVFGSGKDVAFSGGGGGLGCCKAALEGTILAPERKIALSPGKVTGQVISGRNISLASGSLVVCPTPTVVPEIDLRKGAGLIPQPEDVPDGNDSASISIRENPSFTIVVENTGSTTLTNITVSDPDFPSCEINVPFDLAPGEIEFYSCIGGVPSSPFTNVACASADGGVGDCDNATIEIETM